MSRAVPEGAGCRHKGVRSPLLRSCGGGFKYRHRDRKAGSKDVSRPKSSGEYKLKQQRDSTTHLPEQPKSGTLTTHHAGEDVEQQGPPSRLVGVQPGAATLEDSLAAAYKTKHCLTTRSSHHTPWYFPKGAENCVRTRSCTRTSTAASLTIASTWKQPRRPPVGDG